MPRCRRYPSTKNCALVFIGLPEIAFDEAGIEESISSIEEKARNPKEREEGLMLLRQAFEKTGQLEEARRFLEGR